MNKYKTINNTTNIEPTTINPSKWGALFWMLLHTIAKYSDVIPNNMDGSLRALVASIPYILPCNECARHCAEIYQAHQMTSNVSLSTFKAWVWTLRTAVNGYTNTPNITYEQYLWKLKDSNYHISKKQYIDLLACISLNYPYDNSPESINKRNNVFLFVKSVRELLTYVSPLESLNKFVLYNIWKNKIEFQNWLTQHSYNVYRYNPNFNSYM